MELSNLKKMREVLFGLKRESSKGGVGKRNGGVLYLVFLTERRYQLSIGSVSVQPRYLI